MYKTYILVLAGGLTNNKVNNFVKKRLDEAIKLYNTNKNCIIICIGGGTLHKPAILNSSGYILYESSVCAQYLIDNFVNEKDIYREWGSLDTLGNGFFSFTNFIVPLKINEFYLITSNFHMERSLDIFSYFTILILA